MQSASGKSTPLSRPAAAAAAVTGLCTDVTAHARFTSFTDQNRWRRSPENISRSESTGDAPVREGVAPSATEDIFLNFLVKILRFGRL